MSVYARVMSTEQNMRQYYAAFDGTKKDFSHSSSKLFGLIYDDKYLHKRGKKTVVDKDQLRSVESGFMEMGAKITVVHFKAISPVSVEYKLHIVGDRLDVVIHNLATLKDGRLFRSCGIENTEHAVRNARKTVDFYRVEKNLRSCIKFFDGFAKPFEEMEDVHEALFHDLFTYSVKEETITKDQMREALRKCLSDETKSTIEYFKQLDATHFELKLRVQNSYIDVTGHSVGYIKDGQLMKIEPLEHAVPVFATMAKNMRDITVAEMSSLTSQ